MLIKNGRVFTMEKSNDEVLDILIKNNKISKIAKGIKVDSKEEVIDAKGCWVLPGFIDAHTHLGMSEEGIGFEGDDLNEMTSPSTPSMRAIDGCNPLDRGFKKALEAGVTMVMSGPGSANVVGGIFSTFRTYGEYIDEMIVENADAMKCAFGENPKRIYGKAGKTPCTRMGTAAILRKALTDAKNYKMKKEAALKKGADFEINLELENLVNVIDKKIPLKAHAHRADDILTSMRIAKEFDVLLTLDHCTEGHLIIDKIVESKLDALVGPTFLPASKYELRNKGFETIVKLNENKVKVAIITDHPVISIELLPVCAGLAHRDGLPLIDALKTITINPAEIMGVDKMYGSLKIGKMANITIYNDNPLSNLSKCLYTIAEGKVVYKR